MRWRGRGARRTKSYDSEKAWSSINHSILFGREQIRSGAYLVSPHHKNMKYNFLLAWTITAQILFWLLEVSSDLKNCFFMFLMSVQLDRFYRKKKKLIFYRKNNMQLCQRRYSKRLSFRTCCILRKWLEEHWLILCFLYIYEYKITWICWICFLQGDLEADGYRLPGLLVARRVRLLRHRLQRIYIQAGKIIHS